MEKKKLHLICNAHLDPVWLWRWDEGAAEAVSTFRVAADFCEQYDGFVFNHNEAILYQWIEEYEPQLFERIQRLVKAGKWHIMGGWYLQPDCNMPCGEGLIRQIARGREWFYEKFGVLPEVAVNVDSFGHSRGLVQILKKTGYRGYLFCRPLREFLGNVINEWGYDDFVWKGYDGSEVMGHRHFAIYNSPFGKAAEKLDYYIKERGDKQTGLLLWGIGDHGGGPSKIDLETMNLAMEQRRDYEIVHSTPEAYFHELKQVQKTLPVMESDLNPWAVGGYTTQGEVKRRFRKLEQELLATEKMMTAAHVQCGVVYPYEDFREAEEALLFAQFHDIIPGTLVPSALEGSICHMDHGLELLSRIKTRAFFALAGGQRKAEDGEIPLLAYNPHPYPVEGIFICEFHMNQTYSRKRFLIAPHLYRDGVEIPCQLEQEESQMPMQWRRKVAFRAVLNPMEMNRFDCRMEQEPLKEPPFMKTEGGCFRFKNDRMCAVINTRTGYMDSYEADGVEYIKKDGFKALVMEDDDHSIGTFVREFREVCGQFQLMDAKAATEFAGTNDKWIQPVHICEDGAIRTIVEAFFQWNHSAICLRYFLPKEGTEIQVEVIVHWNEKNKLLKLAVPCNLKDGTYMGQVMYGYDELPGGGKEATAQQWTAVKGEGRMLSIINDRVYGSSYDDGEMRLSLLRSPRYGCLSKDKDRYALYNAGYVAHTDQGVHQFRFWMNAGEEKKRLALLDREAGTRHEQPYLLSFFPSGSTSHKEPLVRLESSHVIMSALKPGFQKDSLMLRLYNPGTEAELTGLRIWGDDQRHEVRLGGFEIKTLVYDLNSRTIRETDLLEDRWKKDGIVSETVQAQQ